MCPKVRTILKINQVEKNKNAIIEKGKKNFNFVCSLFLIIKTTPKMQELNQVQAVDETRKLVHQFHKDHEIKNHQIQK